MICTADPLKPEDEGVAGGGDHPPIAVPGPRVFVDIGCSNAPRLWYKRSVRARSRPPSLKISLSSRVNPVRAHPYPPFGFLTEKRHQLFVDDEVHDILLVSTSGRNIFIIGVCDPVLFAVRSGGQRGLQTELGMGSFKFYWCITID